MDLGRCWQIIEAARAEAGTESNGRDWYCRALADPDNLAGHPAIQSAGHPAVQSAGHPAGQGAGHPAGQGAGHPAGQGVAAGAVSTGVPLTTGLGTT